MNNIKRVVDIIAVYKKKLVLIERLSFPKGLALPGGHIEKGERPMATAVREFHEETGLHLSRVRFVTRAQGKHRDPRGESISRVYSGIATGHVRNEKGKTRVRFLSLSEIITLPKECFAFDHYDVLRRVLRL